MDLEVKIACGLCGIWKVFYFNEDFFELVHWNPAMHRIYLVCALKPGNAQNAQSSRPGYIKKLYQLLFLVQFHTLKFS